MVNPTNAAIVDLNGRVWSPFETKDASGFVTYTETTGEIHVPYGTDPVSQTIQAHELSHVRYTSKVWTSVEEAMKRLTFIAATNARIVGYAEDMRITALAGRLGIKTLPRADNPDDADIIQKWVASFVAVGIPKNRVLQAITFILTQHTAVLAKLKNVTLATLQEQDNAERYIVFCAQHIHKLLTTEPKDETDGSKGKSAQKKQSGKTADSKDAAEPEESEKSKSESESDSDKSDDSGKSDGHEGDEEKGDKDDKGEPDEGDSEAEGDADGSSKGGESDIASDSASSSPDITELNLPDIRQAMLESVPSPPDTDKLIQTFQHLLDTARWIPIQTIERVPLVRRAAQSRNKGRKLSETGVALGSAYDAVAPNERRPFTAKRKGGVGGLTVVIDCSGSMKIDPRQLEQLLLKHPQGVVVTYSSFVMSHQNERAVVRVIASHGRLAATENFRDVTAGANGCDGPILEWLAKQPGERIWICDGVITETGDRRIPYHPDTRDAWLKAHHITRFHSLNAYVSSLTS